MCLSPNREGARCRLSSRERPIRARDFYLLFHRLLRNNRCLRMIIWENYREIFEVGKFFCIVAYCNAGAGYARGHGGGLPKGLRSVPDIQKSEGIRQGQDQRVRLCLWQGRHCRSAQGGPQLLPRAWWRWLPRRRKPIAKSAIRVSQLHARGPCVIQTIQFDRSS